MDSKLNLDRFALLFGLVLFDFYLGLLNRSFGSS